MRNKYGFIALPALAAVALLVGTTVASAATETGTITSQTGGLHFTSAPTASTSGTSTKTLTVSGEVAGAGATATATLSATPEVTTGCINKGSKDQQPSGLETTGTQATGTDTFGTRAGKGSFSVRVSAGLGGRTCPDDMTPVLVGVTFTHISLTVTSGANKSTTATFSDIDP